ncbi:hypothetical protein Bbelb_410450, partial [Branchiostoma belcheri]
EQALQFQDYNDCASSLLIWLRNTTAKMEDRNFPKMPDRLKTQLAELNRLRIEVLPAKAGEKEQLSGLHDYLENISIASRKFEVPEDLSTEKIQHAWDCLNLAIQDREKDLLQEIEKFERLRGVAEKVQKESKRCENILNTAEGKLREVDSSQLSPADAKQVFAEVEQQLQTCEGCIKEMFTDVQTLREGGYPQADPLQKKVFLLHERWVHLKNSLQTSSQARRFGEVPAQLRSPTGMSLSEVGEEGRLLQECLSWVQNKQSILESGEYGSDLPSVQRLLEEHREQHRVITEFKAKVDQCIANKSKLMGPKYHVYCEQLAKLEEAYPKLMDMSQKRLQYLESLLEFIRLATLELMWLNEREELELAREWDDKPVNITELDQHYETKEKSQAQVLMQELETREAQFNSLQERGEALALANHPAAKSIEAYMAAMQTQWAWLLQLTSCLEQHTKHTAKYQQFFAEGRDVETWLKEQADLLNTKYNRTDLPLNEAEDLLQEIFEMKESLVEFKDHISSLATNSKQVLPLKQRRQKNTSNITVKAVCSYRQIDLSLKEGDECILIDNSQKTKWQVITPTGEEAFVPSVVFTIPPPCSEAVDYAERLEVQYQELLSLWKTRHLTLKHTVSAQQISQRVQTIKNMSLEQFSLLDPAERDEMLKSLLEDLEQLERENQESGTVDPALLAQLRADVEACQKRFQDLAEQAGKEAVMAEKVDERARQLSSQVGSFVQTLETAEQKLMIRIHTPLPRDIPGVEEVVQESQEFVDNLNVQSTQYKQLRSSSEDLIRTAKQSESLDRLKSQVTIMVQKWDRVWNLSHIYLDKTKTVLVVMKSMEDADKFVSIHEVTLSAAPGLPCEPPAINKQKTDLQETQRETISLQPKLEQLRLDIVNVKDSGTQMTPDQEDPDAARQTEDRLDRINTAANTMDSYQRAWLQETRWLAEMERRLAEQEAMPSDPRMLMQRLNATKDLVNELDQHQPAVEETTRLGEQFIQQAQDYDSQLEQFRSSLNSDLSDAAKKPKIQSSADIVGQQLDDLNRRYRDLVAKTTRNLQLMNSSLAAEEKQDAEGKPTAMATAEEVGKLLDWVKDVDKKLTQQPGVEGNNEQLQQMLKEQQALGEDIVAHQEPVVNTVTTGRQLLSEHPALSKADKQSLEGGLDKLEKGYEGVCDKSAARMDELQSALQQQQDKKAKPTGLAAESRQTRIEEPQAVAIASPATQASGPSKASLSTAVQPVANLADRNRDNHAAILTEKAVTPLVVDKAEGSEEVTPQIYTVVEISPVHTVKEDITPTESDSSPSESAVRYSDTPSDSLEAGEPLSEQDSLFEEDSLSVKDSLSEQDEDLDDGSEGDSTLVWQESPIASLQPSDSEARKAEEESVAQVTDKPPALPPKMSKIRGLSKPPAQPVVDREKTPVREQSQSYKPDLPKKVAKELPPSNVKQAHSTVDKDVSRVDSPVSGIQEGSLDVKMREREPQKKQSPKPVSAVGPMPESSKQVMRESLVQTLAAGEHSQAKRQQHEATSQVTPHGRPNTESSQGSVPPSQVTPSHRPDTESPKHAVPPAQVTLDPSSPSTKSRESSLPSTQAPETQSHLDIPEPSLAPDTQPDTGNIELQSPYDIEIDPEMIFEALERGLINEPTAIRILETQVRSGGIVDPNTAEKLSLEEAQKRELVTSEMAEQLMEAEKTRLATEESDRVETQRSIETVVSTSENVEGMQVITTTVVETHTVSLGVDELEAVQGMYVKKGEDQSNVAKVEREKSAVDNEGKGTSKIGKPKEKGAVKEVLRKPTERQMGRRAERKLREQKLGKDQDIPGPSPATAAESAANEEEMDLTRVGRDDANIFEEIFEEAFEDGDAYHEDSDEAEISPRPELEILEDDDPKRRSKRTRSTARDKPTGPHNTAEPVKTASKTQEKAPLGTGKHFEKAPQKGPEDTAMTIEKAARQSQAEGLAGMKKVSNAAATATTTVKMGQNGQLVTSQVMEGPISVDRSGDDEQTTATELIDSIMTDLEDATSPTDLEDQVTRGGIVDPQTGHRISLVEAADKGLVDPEASMKLLENQAATGGIVDMRTGERFSIAAARISGILDEDTALSLLEAQAMTGGLIDPKTGNRLTFLEALQEGVLDKETAFLLLKRQAETGGVIDPKTGNRVSVKEAVESGIIDEDTALILLDAQVATGGIIDPITGEKLSVPQAVERDIIDSDLADDLLNIQAKSGGILDPATRERLSVTEAEDRGLIDRDSSMRLLEAQLENGGIIDPKSGQLMSIADAQEAGVISTDMALCLLNRQEQDVADDKIQADEEEMDIDQAPAVMASVQVSMVGTESPLPILEQQLLGGGIVDTETGDRLPTLAALDREIIDEELAVELLARESCNGGIRDPQTGERMSVMEAEKHGLINTVMAQKVLEAQARLGGIIDPQTGDRLTVLQALERGIIDQETTQGIFEEQIANGGIVDPRTGKRVSDIQAISQGLVDKQTALALLDAQVGTGGILDPKTGERISVIQAKERGLVNYDTATSLLEAQSEQGGIIDARTGRRLNVFQASQQGHLDNDTTAVLLAKQLSSGGLIHPDTGDEISLEEAVAIGLIPEEVAERLALKAQDVHVKAQMDTQHAQHAGKVSDLLEWIARTENTLSEKRLVRGDLSELQKQLAEQKVEGVVMLVTALVQWCNSGDAIADDITGHQADVDAALKAGREFLAAQKDQLSVEQAKDLQYDLNNLEKGFNNIKEKNEGRIEVLEDMLGAKEKESERKDRVAQQKAEQLEKLQALKNWIAGAAEQLDQQEPISSDLPVLEEQHGQHQELHNDIEAHAQAVADVVQKTHRFLDRQESYLDQEEYNELDELAEDLRAEFSDLKARSEARMNQLDKTLEDQRNEESQKLAVEEQSQAAQERLQDLLETVEQYRSDLCEQEPALQDLQGLTEQTQEHESLHQEISSQQPEVMLALQEAQQLIAAHGDQLSPRARQNVIKGQSKLRNMYDDLNDQSETRLKQMQSMTDELQKFEAECKTFQDWLEEAEGEMEGVKEGASELEGLKEQLDKQKTLSEDVLAHKGDLRFVTMAGQRFLDRAKAHEEKLSKFHAKVKPEEPFSPEEVSPTVQDKLDNLAQRYQNLHTQCGREGKQLGDAVHKHKQYKEAVDSLLPWLQSAKETADQKASEPIGGDPASIQKQIDDLKAFQSEVLAHSGQVDHTRQAGHALLDTQGALADSQDVNNTLSAIDDQVASVNEAISQRGDQLQVALMQSQSLQGSLDGVVRWLDNTEKKLATQGAVTVNKEALAQQTADHKVLADDVSRQQATVASLQETCGKVLASGSPTMGPNLQEYLDDITARYAKVKHQTEERTEDLNRIEGKFSEFEDERMKLQDWLAVAMETMESKPVVHGDLKDLEDKVKEVTSAVETHKDSLENMVQAGNELVGDMKTGDTGYVTQNISKTTQAWDNLNKLLKDRASQLAVQQQLSAEYNTGLEEVKDWLHNMEDRVASLQPVPVDTSKLKQLMEEIMPLIKEHKNFRAKLDKVNDLGAKLGVPAFDEATTPHSPSKHLTPSSSPKHKGITSPGVTSPDRMSRSSSGFISHNGTDHAETNGLPSEGRVATRKARNPQVAQ